MKQIIFSLLLFQGAFGLKSQADLLKNINNINLEPRMRYESMSQFAGKISSCKQWSEDLEFWIRLGCFENYLIYEKQALNLKFIRKYLNDQALAIRSLTLDVLIKIPDPDIENILLEVVQNSENYHKGEPLFIVDNALKQMRKGLLSKEALLSLGKSYPGLQKLASFQNLL